MNSLRFEGFTLNTKKPAYICKQEQPILEAYVLIPFTILLFIQKIKILLGSMLNSDLLNNTLKHSYLGSIINLIAVLSSPSIRYISEGWNTNQINSARCDKSSCNGYCFNRLI